MGTRFVIGRSGSGKSRHCFDSIVEAMRRDPMGAPIFWILPKQATFTAERALTCASGLSGFCRARVLSFEHLGEAVLAECGGSAVPLVTPLGRQMVLGHLLRQHQPRLRFFSSAARQIGLAAELDATFAELERCGRDCDHLEHLLEQLQADETQSLHTQILIAKFHDLHLLYSAYCSFLGQERLDPHRRLEQVLDSIEHCAQLRDAEVFVDEFLDFTDFERRMLSSIAKVARRLEITLVMDPSSPLLRKPDQRPHELSLFHRTEETYRRLHQALEKAGITPEKPLVLKKVERFGNPSLGLIERAMFTPRPGSSRTVQQIELIEAPDRRSEVDAAARCIRQWLDDGLRLRDIAVLARNIDSYHELIDASFREHDLPYFVDRRRPAVHHPLLQFVRSALQLADGHWASDAMMSLVKSGLAGLSLDEADELENYVLLHRIRGDAWAVEEDWSYTRTLERNRDEEELPRTQRIELARINRLRGRVVEPLRQFVQAFGHKKKPTVRMMVVALFELMERMAVRQALLSWMESAEASQQFEQREEHEQVWSELVQLFDQMVDLLGDEVVSLADFLTVLESGLEQFDLGLTPPTVDQVLVGAVDRTRSADVKAAILLGMNDGEFPHVPRDAALLSDSEREVLRENDMEVDRDGQRRLLDENLLGYIAFTRASDRLCVTRCLADDAGRPIAPSPFWRALRTMFPDASLHAIPRDQRDCPQLMGTPRQLITALMRWVREQASGASSPQSTWPALYQWLAMHHAGDDPLAETRFRAWRALRYDNQAALSPEIAQQLFRGELHASVSRIETFATCPFKHFARYCLHLRERDEQDVTVMDLGNVYHNILEKIVAEMVATKQGWEQSSPAAIRDYAHQVGQSLRGELMLSTARNKYLLQRIEKTLEQVIASQDAAGRRGTFRPVRAELGFGIDDAGLPPYTLATPSGRKVHLHGKIDRVDLLEDEAAFAVIDYKLHGNTLALERVYYGIALQLLTYLLVMQAHGQELTGRQLTPAAAFYVRLLRRLEDVKHPEDAIPPDDPGFDLKTKPRGLFDARFTPHLDSTLTSGRSEVVEVHIKGDGQFGYRNSTDVADTGEFQALLAHVHKRLGELSDQITSGRIEARPYRIRQVTPCPHCEFRSVCRFDLLTNRYETLPSMSREQVLQRVSEEAADER